MRILIIGGTGFIGSYLVDEFCKRGDEVVAIGRSLKEWTPYNVRKNFVKFDLAKNSPSLSSLEKFDIVYYLQSTLYHGSHDISWVDIHNKDCAPVERAMTELSYNKFIYISSLSVYSSDLTTTRCPNPVNYYGLTKLISEKIIEINSRKDNDSIYRVIRFPIVIGKHTNVGLVKYLYGNLKNNNPVEIYGDGSRYINIMHVTDAVACLMQLANDDLKTNYFLLESGSSDSMSVLDVFNLMKERLNSSSELRFVTPPIIDNTIITEFDSFIDTSVIRSILKFEPNTTYNSLVKYISEFEVHE